MAALDDILSGGTPTVKPKPVQVSPPPIDGQLKGAENTVGSKPVAQPTAAPLQETKQTPGTDGQPQEKRQEQTEEKKRLSYVEMFEALNPQKPETAEERAKREKREKREAVLAAVGDGISALSNLFFTTQYAPNAYDPSKGMSAKARERWDRLRLEREANRRAYSDGYLRALAMDEAGDREERNWRHTLERERIADERYEIKAAQDKAMADLNEQLRRHQITAAEHKAEQERIAAQFAEESEKLKQENLRAGVRQKDAAAGASYSRARYYDNGGSRGKGKSGPTLQLEDDEPMRFGDDKDYDRAVMRLAPDYGVATTTVEVTEYDEFTQQPKKQRTVQRPVKDIAADIEREAAKRKKSKSDTNTMPGVGGGGSTNTMPGVK
ncbi:hypothetical protein [Muribaculum intestinale]|uniref:hypothetical protein n=1 Tax=Muribaculum intestinale TaxID=1796646 RepID=UPI0025A60426|nr:hypothetical protein [Muribaculum intestinale]